MTVRKVAMVELECDGCGLVERVEDTPEARPKFSILKGKVRIDRWLEEKQELKWDLCRDCLEELGPVLVQFCGQRRRRPSDTLASGSQTDDPKS